jgi:hypothetical protein
MHVGQWHSYANSVSWMSRPGGVACGLLAHASWGVVGLSGVDEAVDKGRARKSAPT